MAGIITLEADRTSPSNWSSANWVFDSLLDCVLAHHPADPAIRQYLLVARAHQILELDVVLSEDPELAMRIVAALAVACDHISSGDELATVDGRILDAESQAQFREAIGILASTLQRYFASASKSW